MEKKIYLDQSGVVDEMTPMWGVRRHVPFPLCLAVQHGENFCEVCPDFILSPEESRVFVKTETPLPKGSRVIVHFYIPPDSKLLGEFRGKVVTHHKNEQTREKAMQIRMLEYSGKRMEHFRSYLEEKKRLIDLMV